MEPIIGIEFGSTRIKAVAIDAVTFSPLAQGAHEWENTLKDGVWTYTLAEAEAGLQDAFAKLKADYAAKTGGRLTKLRALGVSGMMHGYLPFDKEGRQLADFRTWRNTITERAAKELTEAFAFNIPQRWSIAHLYEEILNHAETVKRIDYLTTLAGYIHWRLSGRKVMGVGEASGMFPVDPETCDYDQRMVETFDRLCAGEVPWKMRDIFPKILLAGGDAGTLTEAGARLLDPTGELEAGCVLAPPEGDVQTGMMATNAIAPRSANISAGTSVFAVVVLEKALKGVYPEIDVIASPLGKMAAMSHANTCTSDINAWVRLLGGDFGKLFRESLNGAPDCGGVTVIPFLGGEPVVKLSEGCPMVIRTPDADFTLANFMRAHIYSAFAVMRLGLDILAEEGLTIDHITGHGGIFKEPGVAQQYLADAIGAAVTCMETAGEGGPWGMALLAAYAAEKGTDLDAFLKSVFIHAKQTTLQPDPKGAAGFAAYLARFTRALQAEKALLG